MTKKKPTRVRRIDHASTPHRVLVLCLTALAVALLVEGMNQGTPARMIDYLVRRTFYFACNYLIILTTLSLTELVRRRRALLILLCAAWIGFGFANYMCCRIRTNPLLVGDLFITREIFELITVYFSWPEIIAMCLGAMTVIVGGIMLFTRTSIRRRFSYGFGVGFVAACTLTTLCVTLLATQAGLLPKTLAEPVYAYRDYGFSTCFTHNLGVLGVSRPEDYSEAAVEEILEEIGGDPQPAPLFDESDDLSRPNLVFVQLESFFDVDTLRGLSLSRDPIPNFHRLVKTCPTGKLYVPTIGGGTANVEFEVLSGMNMDFFGAGETPYNTIIQEKTCETIAHILKKLGYSATAIHDNTGTFYSRNEVYANLGFDRFIPLEYMPEPKYIETGWARDEVLGRIIPQVLETTESRDLVFTIAVESHGKYADTYEPKPLDIEVLSLPESMEAAQVSNYVNILSDVDAFIGSLLNRLNACGEPTICVLYGDHLPGLGLEIENLATQDVYTSRYVIWNNYGAEFEAPDLQAYRLSAELLRQLGISDGVMTRFHQSYPPEEADEAMLEKLQTLEYDLLYGDQEAYGGFGAPAREVIALGLEPIRVTAAAVEYGRLLVTGEHFTPYSKILVGGVPLETAYIDETQLAAFIADQMPELHSLCIAQITPDGQELGRTEEFPIS